MAPLLLLALLGQTVRPVPRAPASPLPLKGQAPRATHNGSEYVVTWADQRFDALQARPMDPFVVRTDLFAAFLGANPNTTRAQHVWRAAPRGPVALAASRTTGQVNVFWLEDAPRGIELRHLALFPDAGVRFDDPPLGPFQAADELTATWSGAHALVAWSDSSQPVKRVQFAWFDALGNVSQSPSSLGSIAGFPASTTVATIGGGARIGFLDTLRQAWRTDLTDNGNNPTTPVNVAPTAEVLTLDPLGDFAVVGASTSSTYRVHLFGPASVEALGIPFSGQAPAVATALPRQRSVVAVESMGAVQLQAFPRDAGFSWPVWNFPGELAPALASNGANAVLVTTGPGDDLRVRDVALEMMSFADAGYRPLATARPLRRRPSVAWAGDRFVAVFEEQQGGAAFSGRYVTFDAGSIVGGPVQLPGQAPAILTTPDGGLLLRYDTGGVTVTARVAQSGGALTFLGNVLTSSPTPAGGATDSHLLHWAVSGAAVTGPMGQSSIAFAGSRPYRTSASVGGALWLPVATGPDGGANLGTVYVPDGQLDFSGTFPPPAFLHTSDFDADITPAIAGRETPQGPRLIIVWVPPGRNAVNYSIFSPGQMLLSPQRLTSTASVVGVAATPTGNGFLVAQSSAYGVSATVVDDDGRVVAVYSPPLPRGALVGEPAAATAPSGDVAVVWPQSETGGLSVDLQAMLWGPFSWPDAGPRDAGTPDAGVMDGGAMDAGTTPDAGTPDAGPLDAGPLDAGTTPDAGVTPDGGTGPLVFDTSGCACTTAPASAGWWVLLAVALLAARRRARG